MKSLKILIYLLNFIIFYFFNLLLNKYFSSFFMQDIIIIPFSLNNYNLKENLMLFNFIYYSFKFLSFYSFTLFSIIFSYNISKKIQITKKKNVITAPNILLIGKDNENDIYVSEKGQFQNFLITGSIGSGKTSSSIYPFCLQFFEMQKYEKIGFLILDVKGNFMEFINSYCKNLKNSSFYEISLESGIFYNPLDKPNLKPQVLANRLRIILELLASSNKEDSYWLEKCEITLSHAIAIIRLYNDNYVNFTELHKIIFNKKYYMDKIQYLQKEFLKNKLTTDEIFALNASLSYFENEFYALDERTLNIIKSEIGRITSIFVSDLDIIKAFCPPKDKINFKGFNDLILNGGIVVLNLNMAKYRNLAKIIATYLKLDFQTEVLENISKSKIKKIFICDEYDKYATSSDGEFFSLSREAKCINIVSTQSYSSILQSVTNETDLKVIIQNLVNKIWYRQDDNYTIEMSQKLLGQEYKRLQVRSISENSNDSNYNFFTKSFSQTKSNISESLSDNIQKDYIYDISYFSNQISCFEALVYLSDGQKMMKSKKIRMLPYFERSKN